MSMNKFVQYEVASSWWAGLIWWNWGQAISAKYFNWKTERKFKRLERHLLYKAAKVINNGKE